MGTTIPGGFYLDQSGKAHDANGKPIPASMTEAPEPVVIETPILAPSLDAITNPTATTTFDNKAKVKTSGKIPGPKPAGKK